MAMGVCTLLKVLYHISFAIICDFNADLMTLRNSSEFKFSQGCFRKKMLPIMSIRNIKKSLIAIQLIPEDLELIRNFQYT